ncbi:hypothetical protein S245_055559, partial [Arachis hypogaea]
IWIKGLVLEVLVFALAFVFASADDVVCSAKITLRRRCGHCKKLAPEYEKLGSSFKKAKSVLIGKGSKEIREHQAYCRIMLSALSL